MSAGQHASPPSVSAWTNGIVLLLILIAGQPLRAVEAIQADVTRYAVTIDAGSTGSRVRVYAYSRGKATPSTIPQVKLPGFTAKTTPGLSFYAPTGAGAGQSLQLLLDQARTQVPAALHKSTPLHVLATAGLRMLPTAQIAAIIQSVASVCVESGFLFRPEWVRVLPGTSEGLYAWIAFNTAAGTLQALALEDSRQPASKQSPAAQGAVRQRVYEPPGKSRTWSVVEMGGASVQLTFLPPPGAPRPELQPYLTIVGMPGLDASRPLYARSFLGVGADVTFRNITRLTSGQRTNPCLSRGYTGVNGVPGSGDFHACAQLLLGLLGPSCRHAGSTGCRLGGTAAAAAPDVEGVVLATEVLYHTAKQIGLPHGVPPAVPTSTPKSEGEQRRRRMQSLPRPLRQGVSTPRGVSPGGSLHAGVGVQRAWRWWVRELGRVPRNLAAAAGSSPGEGSPAPSLNSARDGSLKARLVSPAQLAQAGTAFCARPWSQVERQIVTEDKQSLEYARKACFNAAWSWVILRAGLRFPDHAKRLLFSNEVQALPDGTPREVNWVLGAVLQEVLTDLAAVEGTGGDGLVVTPPATLHAGSSAAQWRRTLIVKAALGTGLVVLVVVAGLLMPVAAVRHALARVRFTVVPRDSDAGAGLEPKPSGPSIALTKQGPMPRVQSRLTISMARAPGTGNLLTS